MHESTSVGVFLVKAGTDIEGIVAFAPLSAEGLAAILAGLFDPIDPAPRHLVVPGGELAALYGWGVAAANSNAARRLVAAYQAMVSEAIPTLPVFARAATLLGERLLTKRLGYRPYPGSMTGLLWTAPYSERQRVAA